MAQEEEDGGPTDQKPHATAKTYDEAMDNLSSLITQKYRADVLNSGNNFNLMFDYVKILDLEEAISKMKIIHVAGTKGKVETPDKVGREAILDVHVSKKELLLAEDVDLAKIASIKTGFTGADLTNLVNEAACWQEDQKSGG